MHAKRVQEGTVLEILQLPLSQGKPVGERSASLGRFLAVQQSFLARGFPTVHGWVFNMSNGIIKDLQINFRETLRNIQEVYDLTGTNWR